MIPDGEPVPQWLTASAVAPAPPLPLKRRTSTVCQPLPNGPVPKLTVGVPVLAAVATVRVEVRPSATALLMVTLPAPVTVRFETCMLTPPLRVSVPASAPMVALAAAVLTNTAPVRVLVPLRFLRAPLPSGPAPAMYTFSALVMLFAR